MENPSIPWSDMTENFPYMHLFCMNKMKKITSIVMLIVLTLPTFGKSLLEFRLVQEAEKTEWKKVEFEGKPIWVSPTCEIDTQHISSAKLTWEGPPWSLLSPDKQAEFKKQHPEITNFDRQPQISITFTPNGAKLIEELTTKHKGQRLAVIYEDKILIAPTIYESIKNGSITIGGSFTEPEARSIVSKINTNTKSRTSASTLSLATRAQGDA
jgi:preprotein translocase subunit SecD